MNKERIKVYTYKRVSTAMQIDGYSLDAQRSRMKAYADFNDYEIVGEYEDAGKSGKSIEGRMQFRQMMEDVNREKTISRMSWYLSYPVLGEMRQTSFPLYRSCRTLA